MAARQILALVVGVRVPARQPPIRRILAIGLLVEAAVVAAAAWWLLSPVFLPGALLAALVLLATAPFAAWALWHGRWSDDPASAVLQAAASAVAAIAQVGLGVVAVMGISAALAASDRCDEPFDAERWRADEGDDREALAVTIVRCGTLEGDTAAQVRGVLGPPRHRGERRWLYIVGDVNDLLGPGDLVELVVRFGPDGRVVRASAPGLAD